MKKLRVMYILIIFFAIFIIPVKATANEIKEKVILIDPGHGGVDGGAQSKSGTIEKGINLEISKKLKTNLESKGYKVVMTREDDNGLYSKGTTIREKKREDLKKRCEMKKEVSCDVFISIHQNMFAQSKCYGAQVWHASNDKSAMLAKNIQSSLKETINDNNNRIEKAAGDAYLILRDNYDGASVIVECGFLSNPEEDIRLKSEEHQNKIVEGLSLGIDKYFEG